MNMYIDKLTTSKIPLNFKIQSNVGFCVSCVRNNAWTSRPGFIKWYSLDDATLLLPADATAATRGQYLDFSKVWRFQYL